MFRLIRALAGSALLIAGIALTVKAGLSHGAGAAAFCFAGMMLLAAVVMPD